MDGDNRLGLVKKSLGLLLSQLRPDDRVGIVVYSNNSRVLLSPTPVSDRVSIQAMIDSIRTEGGTNAEAGLRLGYDLALANRIEGEATRIILLSDGVANVGNTGPDAILNTIKLGVEAGITLSTIGFGMGNYNDVLMEQLANNGDGNYYYVDTLREAERVFIYNLTGTLQVVGYDAKIQVEFNPEVADRYRLLGYENRAIADEDFRDDAVDAGEVGAGHHVTALYEFALEDAVLEGVIATVYIRYEDAESRQVMERKQSITIADMLNSMDEAPTMFKIQVAVAEFAELLRGSFWAQEGSYAQVLAMLEIARAELPEDRTLEELVLMVRTAMDAQKQ
jgi:Ca-activated chloride channel homolog